HELETSSDISASSSGVPALLEIFRDGGWALSTSIEPCTTPIQLQTLLSRRIWAQGRHVPDLGGYPYKVARHAEARVTVCDVSQSKTNHGFSQSFKSLPPEAPGQSSKPRESESTPMSAANSIVLLSHPESSLSSLHEPVLHLPANAVRPIRCHCDDNSESHRQVQFPPTTVTATSKTCKESVYRQRLCIREYRKSNSSDCASAARAFAASTTVQNNARRRLKRFQVSQIGARQVRPCFRRRAQISKVTQTQAAPTTVPAWRKYRRIVQGAGDSVPRVDSSIFKTCEDSNSKSGCNTTGATLEEDVKCQHHPFKAPQSHGLQQLSKATLPTRTTPMCESVFMPGPFRAGCCSG
ncbi:hypothetical protein EDB84DRAFT_1441985, partial [Lactarius hengduanensis]